MSNTNEKLKIWLPTLTKTDAHSEALTEAVRRAMERQARRAHRNAQSHNQVQVTPFQLRRDTKATWSVSITKHTHTVLLDMVHCTCNGNNCSWCIKEYLQSKLSGQTRQQRGCRYRPTSCLNVTKKKSVLQSWSKLPVRRLHKKYLQQVIPFISYYSNREGSCFQHRALTSTPFPEKYGKDLYIVCWVGFVIYTFHCNCNSVPGVLFLESVPGQFRTGNVSKLTWF